MSDGGRFATLPRDARENAVRVLAMHEDRRAYPCSQPALDERVDACLRAFQDANMYAHITCVHASRSLRACIAALVAALAARAAA